MKNRRKLMKITGKDGYREFIRKHNRMRWKHRKWSRNTQKSRETQKMEQNDENDGYDEKQMKNNEWWDSERGMGGIGGKKDEKPEWREDQPSNQQWLEIITFKTEQKHRNQKENKEIDRHKWKTEENGWKQLKKMGFENS